MCGVQTCSVADVARELDMHWVEHRIVWTQLDYREVCVYWVTKRIQNMMTNRIFGPETWLITQNLTPGKG